jgi:hypothetical protein
LLPCLSGGRPGVGSRRDADLERQWWFGGLRFLDSRQRDDRSLARWTWGSRWESWLPLVAVDLREGRRCRRAWGESGGGGSVL